MAISASSRKRRAETLRRRSWSHAPLPFSAQKLSSVIATGLPHSGRGDVATWSKIYAAIAPQVCGVRRMGAASLDLAWVAAGRFDGFWEDDLDYWDTAAGLILVREAGGFVSDYRGQDRMVDKRQYLATSSELHSKLHKLLAGALR